MPIFPQLHKIYPFFQKEETLDFDDDMFDDFNFGDLKVSFGSNPSNCNNFPFLKGIR